MAEVNKPHDAFFKQCLSKKENARSFLENYLPAELLPLLSLDKLEIEKDSFITPELQEYFSDMLYSVDFSGHAGYVYILFEHKSYKENWIGLQLLEYMLQCWKLKRDQKQALPVIIPIVIYHGTKKWNIGTKLSDLVKCPDTRLLYYVPDFHYILCNLSQYQDDKIVGVANLKAALFLLKYIKSHELEKKLEMIFRFLGQGLDKDTLIAITIYIVNEAKFSRETLTEITDKNLSKEKGEIIMTIAEQLRQEGEIKGKIEGKKEILRNLLKEGLDNAFIAKITGLSQDEIQALQKEMKKKTK
jgi:predicted transposase/invertase (TIGR01784 family)